MILPLLRLLSRALAVVSVAAAVAHAPSAAAEKADRDKPINYQADTGDVNVQTKAGTLQGNVILTQGTLTIHADKIVFQQNPDNSVSATAWGNPITFREKRDGVDEYYEGVAQRAKYDGETRFLELFDRALLRKGKDEIRSNYISYNADTEFFKAEGRPDTGPAAAGEPALGARVRGVFQPQQKDKDGTAGKSGKAPAAPPKPNPPAPLKPDAALSTGSAK
ncbi:MAG TPA: lipopolysaccharide transport periplasmic protein LptA [Casimicrobiaceae bacterium]